MRAQSKAAKPSTQIAVIGIDIGKNVFHLIGLDKCGHRPRPRFQRRLGIVPKQLSTGGRTILGKISKRGNKYLRMLFVQAAHVVLLKRVSWERYGLKNWIEAAAKRLHHNKLAIALANKLARIAWAVLHHGRNFEVSHEYTPQPA